MKNYSKTSHVLVGLICLACGVGIGYLLNSTKTKDASFTILRATEPEYTFIHPLVGIDITSEPAFAELEDTKKTISAFLQQETSLGHLTRASTYIRTLKNAHWFSINDKEKFTPGSLLKVPIMMAYFKEAETNPSVLQKKVYYQKDTLKKLLPNELESELKEDNSYTIHDLIASMIVDSDNKAKDLLMENIQPTYLVDVFGELGVPLDGNSTEFINARVYASFFRRLYNATFLSREHSEEALTLLSKTTYRNGLLAGVPKGTLVAHKYGERGVYAENNTLVGVELHDCGILYLPKQDILTCVMTEGKNVVELENVIKKIAEVVSDKLGK
jgi:beta-lactamase class A